MKQPHLTLRKIGRSLLLITTIAVEGAALLPAATSSGSAVPAAPVSEGRVGPAAIFPDGHVFRLEVARTQEERARGYMFRERIEPGEGMLFLFPRDDFHTFWMKNCRVPLDMIWLSEDLKVVHLEKEVPPCRKDPCPSYPPMRKARFVLEVRAGMAQRSGLQVGDILRVEGVDFGASDPP